MQYALQTCLRVLLQGYLFGIVSDHKYKMYELNFF